MSDLYGWYDSATQSAECPTYDPPHNSPCPYCGAALRNDDVRTHSFIAVSRPLRCYFYRTHRTCDEAASPGMRQSIFGGVLDRITSDTGATP